MSYAKNTSVPVDRSMSQARLLLSKNGGDGTVIAETTEGSFVQFIFEGMNYKFVINYPDGRADKIRYTNSGKLRTDNQIQIEIEAEKRRLWRAMVLYIKAAIEAHQNGLVDLKRSLMGNIALPEGGTLYEKLESDVVNICNNPKLLIN